MQMVDNPVSSPDAQLRVYCTLFDSNYLLKGAVMIESLHRVAPRAIVYVLCMDALAIDLLQTLSLPGVRLIRLEDVEDDDLRRVKRSRSTAEYCWTLSAALCWYVMNDSTDAGSVTYLDADLMFFSSVEPLFDEMGDASISITEHRYPPELDHLSVYGRFNVQWVVFRRDATGLACLARWRAQCIEWCFARLEDGRLGDQKYLEEWPGRYGSAVNIVSHPGAGVAPWNVFASRMTRAQDGGILVNGARLVFYHFHQFQLLADGRVDAMPPLYSKLGPIPTEIYAPYEEALQAMLARIRVIRPGFDRGLRSSKLVFTRRLVRRFVPMYVKNLLRRIGVQPW